jgi:hypothetical protein
LTHAEDRAISIAAKPVYWDHPLIDPFINGIDALIIICVFKADVE